MNSETRLARPAAPARRRKSARPPCECSSSSHRLTCVTHLLRRDLHLVRRQRRHRDSNQIFTWTRRMSLSSVRMRLVLVVSSRLFRLIGQLASTAATTYPALGRAKCYSARARWTWQQQPDPGTARVSSVHPCTSFVVRRTHSTRSRDFHLAQEQLIRNPFSVRTRLSLPALR